MKTKEHNVGPHNLFVEEYIPDKESYKHPLVLVHGSFGGAFMWKIIADYLVSKGFHLYVLSLRGHKPNDTSMIGEIGMQDYADDVKAVVDGLKLKTPVVVGHSMSGLVVLMYAAHNPVHSVISIGPSPSVEAQGSGDEKAIEQIPNVYSPMDAGMPTDPEEVMKALPDIPQDMLMKMKDMLGPESGKARRDRKRGISVPKESITYPLLVMGGELASSVKFGVPPMSTKKMAEYYGADFIQIKEATHPGILMGTQASETAMAIEGWLA